MCREEQMSSWQSILTSPAFSALGGFLLRDIYEFLVRPVLNRVLNRIGFDTHQRRSPLQMIRDLDEVCARDVPVTEDELCKVLGINRRKLRRLWKEEDKTIRSGYIIEKSESNEGYWTVKLE